MRGSGGVPEGHCPEHPAAQGAGCLASVGGHPGLRDALRVGLSQRMRELCLVSVLPRERKLPPALLAAGLCAGRLALRAGMLSVSTLETFPSPLRSTSESERGRGGTARWSPHAPGHGEGGGRLSPGDAERVLSGTFPSPTQRAEALPTRGSDVHGRTWVPLGVLPR